jgi:hypothetical protein
MKSTHADWLRDRKINILFQVGPRREPDLPDVPLWSELGESEGQRQILEILSGDVAVGYAYGYLYYGPYSGYGYPNLDYRGRYPSDRQLCCRF